MTAGAADGVGALEVQLVRRARDGDTDAYGELVTMHQTAAFRVAWLVVGSTADAEDAAQEGFVRAYLALPRFREGLPFRPWLLEIVGNEARNRRRSRSRRDGMLARAMAAARGDGADAAAPPERLAIVGETRAEVREAIASLGEGERLVVACRYLLDLSEAETAAALGIPAGTVKSRLHRGLGRLGDRLRPVMGIEP